MEQSGRTKTIEFIVGQILSIWLPERISSFEKQREQKKRKEELETQLKCILQGEERNGYYNALTRVLENSRLLHDVVNGCLSGTPLSCVDERINSILCREQIDELNRGQIAGVIKKMIDCITSVMMSPSEESEKRLSYQIKELLNSIGKPHEQSQVLLEQSNTLSLSEIEVFCEPIMDVSHSIPRKLLKTGSDSTDDTRLSWNDVLKTSTHVVIVNDASYGKTFSLYQLYHEAPKLGYIPVYLSLNRYPGIPLFDVLQQKHLADSRKVVLILDGYDEIIPQCLSQFENTIETVGNRFPDMRIVLSSRSNFYAHHPIRYDLFRLAEITDDERRNYIEKKGIDSRAFYQQVRERRLDGVCETIFYLVELMRLWELQGSLPDEADVMGNIVDCRIRADREKYRLSAPELEEQTALLRKRFERIAVVMQCTHQARLTNEQLGEICSEEESKYLELHGLWEVDAAGCWVFVHNNFREYFAACWLMRKPLEDALPFFSWYPEKEKVKPSWMNVLAYMAKKKGSRQLQDWIAENDPSIITLFERDSFSKEQRSEIFQRVYEQHEANLTWADVDHDALKRMGSFASCGISVEYILDKLTKKTHLRQEKNLLRVMRFFDDLYGYEDECSLVIGSLAFDDDYPAHVRADALGVMREFPHVFEKCAQTAAEKALGSKDSYYRYHLLRFIQAAGKLSEYFEVIIHELQQPIADEAVYDVGRQLFLEEVCSKVQDEGNAVQLIEFAREHPEYIEKESVGEIGKNLLGIAVRCEESYRNRFLNAILELFSAVQHRFSTEINELIKEYMVATKTERRFLDHILSDEQMIVDYAVWSIACPSLIEVLIDYYNKGEFFDSEILRRLAGRLRNQEPMRMRIVRAVYIKTGIEIPTSDDVLSKESEEKGQKLYFDSLFSKLKFTALVNELCRLLGKDTPVFEANLKFWKHTDREPALTRCLHVLANLFRDNKEITLGKALEKIKEWESFQWENFQYVYVCNEVLNAKDLSVSDIQRKWIEDHTREKLSDFDGAETYKVFVEHGRYRLIHKIALSIVAKLNMAHPLDFLRSLVIVPAWLMGEKEYAAFSQYLLNNIPKDEMVRQVLHNIQNEELCGDVAVAHLKYCTDHKLKEAKGFALNFLREDDSDGYRYYALKYISELFGYEMIVDEVVPLRDDEAFLRDIAAHIPLDASAPLLDGKLETLFAHNPTDRLRSLMIRRNHRSALEDYYHKASQLKTLPDMTEGNWVPDIVDEIRYVKKPELLDIVIKLLRLCRQPDFVDKESFGLHSSCWEAIKNIALVDYQQVKESLLKEIDQASGDYKLTCIDLLQRIDELHEGNMDQGLSFKMALALSAE